MEQLLQKEVATLRCSLCLKIVSVPPVDLLSKDGKQLRCGRCENVPKESFGRNYAYEKIAKLLSFPCTYDGCREVIPWGKVKDHEEVCNEKTVMCPIDPQICFAVKVINLEKHCLHEHIFNIFYESVTVKYDTSKHLPCVLVFRKQIFFILTVGYNNTYFDIYVASLNNHTSLKYNIKLASLSNDACVMFEQQDFKKYDERIDCFNCILNKCSLAYHYHHHYKLFNNHYGNPKSGWGKRIQLQSIKSLFEDTKEINFKLEIVANKSPNNDIEPTDVISSYQTSHLRNSLQCPICIEYMIEDIFSCENGHVVCRTCRAKLDSCPSCQSKFGKSRNLPLENLAEVLMLSCSFAEKGCNFSGHVKMLFKHEKECAHKED